MVAAVVLLPELPAGAAVVALEDVDAAVVLVLELDEPQALAAIASAASPTAPTRNRRLVIWKFTFPSLFLDWFDASFVDGRRAAWRTLE